MLCSILCILITFINMNWQESVTAFCAVSVSQCLYLRIKKYIWATLQASLNSAHSLPFTLPVLPSPAASIVFPLCMLHWFVQCCPTLECCPWSGNHLIPASEKQDNYSPQLSMTFDKTKKRNVDLVHLLPESVEKCGLKESVYKTGNQTSLPDRFKFLVRIFSSSKLKKTDVFFFHWEGHIEEQRQKEGVKL